MRERVDIDEAMADWKVKAVLDAWLDARQHEAPAFSGGVRDAWPALMVDGLAIASSEDIAVDRYRGWLEAREEAPRG